MSVLPRILLIWLISLGILTVLIRLSGLIPDYTQTGVDFLCCQDSSSYLAYRWLSSGLAHTQSILREVQRFASGEELDLCFEKRVGIWGWLFGRNKPKEKGYFASGICDINNFIAQQTNPATRTTSPSRWLREAYDRGLLATMEKVLRKSYRGFKKAWGYFVDVPGVAAPARVTKPSLTEAILLYAFDYRLIYYLNLFAIGSGIWMIAAFGYQRLIVTRNRQKTSVRNQMPTAVSLFRSIVAKYIAEKLIKTGPDYHVFHLTCRETRRGVFMKVLRKGSTKAARQGLAKAYRATRSLQHSNIVRFIDWIEGASSSCLGLEFAFFGNLRDSMLSKAADIKVTDKISIFTQVFSAVSFLHRSEVAHLNIRPGSVLVFDKWFCIKLSGFVTATKVSVRKYCSQYDLHPIAIPNEVINREPYDPFRADIWALGSLLFYILVGDFFQNETSLPLRRVIFPVLSGCDVAQKKTIIVLLANLLACDPLNRPELSEIQSKLDKLQL